MMKKKTINRNTELTLFQLIIIGIFILSLAIRIYGAQSIGFTNSESEFLLSLSNIKRSGTTTLFYELIVKLVQFLGINGQLGIRLVNILMGALVTIFPAMFVREIGKRTAIFASLFLTFDPFGIANSIIFSGNISTLFFLGLFLNAILNDRKNSFDFLILFLIGHGRGMGTFIFFVLELFIILLFENKNSFLNLTKRINEIFSQNISLKISSVIILILILVIIFQLPLSNIASDISEYVSGWNGDYLTGNYPIVYLFALLASLPLFVVISIVFFIKRTTESENKKKKLYAIWLSFVIATVMFYPKHLIIDLIWISVPLCIFAAISVDEFLSYNSHFFRDEWVFLVILFLAAINLGLNLIAYVYRSIWGLDIANSLLSILFIVIFTIVLLIYKAYMSSVSKVISCLDLVLLVIGGIFHLSISARAIGSNNKPEHEILWNGYFEGNEIMAGIVDTTKTNLYGTAGKLNVYIDKEVEPVEIWSLNSENVYFQKNSSLSIPPEMIISSNQIIDMNDYDFQGQEFVSNSYPMWTWDPVNSFFSTDYWNWFFFRNNLQYKEYNFIWTNRTLMNKKIY